LIGGCGEIDVINSFSCLANRGVPVFKLRRLKL